MSIEVKCFDEKGAEAELAKCPQIVKDYVKKLKNSRDSWKDICAEAVSKLRNASKNNCVLHGVSNSVCPINNAIKQDKCIYRGDKCRVCLND